MRRQLRFKAKQLSSIKQLAIVGIAPTMKSRGFIAGRYLVVRHKLGFRRLPLLFSVSYTSQVFPVRLLEKTPLMLGLAMRIVSIRSQTVYDHRGAAPERGKLLTCPHSGQAHRPRRAGPATCSVDRQCLQCPGFSSWRLRSTRHRMHKQERFGDADDPQQPDTAGNKSISCLHSAHERVLTQRKYLTGTFLSPYMGQSVTYKSPIFLCRCSTS